MLPVGSTPIYLVMGEMNGWQWPVAAYTSQDRAERHRSRAQHAAKTLAADRQDMPHVVAAEARNPYDSDHCCAGMYMVEYRVEAVTWCDAESTPDTTVISEGGDPW